MELTLPQEIVEKLIEHLKQTDLQDCLEALEYEYKRALNIQESYARFLDKMEDKE